MRRIFVPLLSWVYMLTWVGCHWNGTVDATILPQEQEVTVTESNMIFYVRPDGGDTQQCNGLANAPYPGNGTGKSCAWDHPFRALPPGGSPLITGGSVLEIAYGSYQMGLGAPGADNPDVCSSDNPWDCHMPPIPSGPDENHPTRILGAGWNAGCKHIPELWGTERVGLILNLMGSSNVEIACLEITDHVGCAEDHTGGMACKRDSYPYGEWAAVGLYAQDSANVKLRELDFHGLAVHGVWAGRLSEWTIDNVRIAANGWAGWDGDIEGDDTNVGELNFRGLIVEWNGCVETYPGKEPMGCWGQSAGGYGDGIGTGSTGGDWIFEDSYFMNNTSDGLDLLYHDQGGSITLRRIRAEGNAGNPVKVTGYAYLENSVLIANCSFFEEQPFTYHVDSCRAMGNALELSFTGGEEVQLLNNTIFGHGDGLVGAAPREGYDCSGREFIFGRNNLFYGGGDYFDTGDQSFLFYYEDCHGLTFDSDYSLYYDVKLSEYSPGSNDINLDPLLRGPLSNPDYGMDLTMNSPAIDAGDNSVCPLTDHHGTSRPLDGNQDGRVTCDIGAYEWNPDNARIYLPFLAVDLPGF